jgi:hypothetical protein
MMEGGGTVLLEWTVVAITEGEEGIIRIRACHLTAKRVAFRQTGQDALWQMGPSEFVVIRVGKGVILDG